jgi:hypothetical protein
LNSIQKKETNINNLLYCFSVCVLIFLYTLNIVGRYEIISYLFLTIAVLQIFFGRTICRSWQTLFIAALFILYAFVAHDVNGENKLPLLFQCLIFYIVGMRLSRYSVEHENRNIVFQTVFWGCCGFVIHTILTVATSSITTDRRLTDFSDGYLVAATQLIAWCVCFFAILPWSALRWKSLLLIEKISVFVFTILAVAASLKVSSRTGVIVFAVAIIILLIWSLWSRRIKLFTGVAVILTAAVIAYINDIAGFKTALLTSNLANRLATENDGLFNSPRFARWQYLFSHFTDYMWGGYHYSNQFGGQLHNVIFDLYDECGIAVTILFILVLIRLIYGMVRLITKRKDVFPDNVGIVLWFVIIGFVLFSEPVWNYGRYMFIAFWFFMLGTVEYQAFFAPAD